MSGYWMERDKKVVKAIEEIITRDFSDDDGPVKGAVRDLVSTDLATAGSGGITMLNTGIIAEKQQAARDAADASATRFNSGLGPF